MMSIRLPVVVALVLLISGCAASSWENHEWFLHRKGVSTVTAPDRFEVCDAYGCERISRVSLTAQEWQGVRDLFGTPVASGAEERQRIAQAVALLERAVGAKVGYDQDLSGTFKGGGGVGQLDCIDETVNTTVFLTLMYDDGLLEHHDLRGPASRGHFMGSWPHQTAVVTERATGQAFAIDSWFHHNGHPAEVVPLQIWLDGWLPEGFEDPLI